MLSPALIATLPAETSFQHRADGFQLHLAGRARVRVSERVRPVAAFGAIVTRVRRELAFAPPPPGRAAEIVTDEGERAATHHLAEGERACSIGVAYGDDFYRLIVGSGDAGAARELESIVDRLARQLPLGLAYRRRRWYAYEPPPGWGAYVRHRLVAEWHAPRFPRERAMLTVFPARPFSDTPAGAMDRHLHEMTWGGYTLATIARPELLTLSERLTGVRWQLAGTWLDGAHTSTEVVVLHDGTFMYMMRLDHDDQQTELHRAVFQRVIESVRPLPPLPTLDASHASLSYLAE